MQITEANLLRFRFSYCPVPVFLPRPVRIIRDASAAAVRNAKRGEIFPGQREEEKKVSVGFREIPAAT